VSENKYTIWELIKYVFSFIFHRRKNAEDQRKKVFEKVAEELDGEFKKIDKKKESKKQKNLEKRLNNMF